LLLVQNEPNFLVIFLSAALKAGQICPLLWKPMLYFTEQVWVASKAADKSVGCFQSSDKKMTKKLGYG
jgi:hypothetical protein